MLIFLKWRTELNHPISSLNSFTPSSATQPFLYWVLLQPTSPSEGRCGGALHTAAASVAVEGADTVYTVKKWYNSRPICCFFYATADVSRRGVFAYGRPTLPMMTSHPLPVCRRCVLWLLRSPMHAGHTRPHTWRVEFPCCSGSKSVIWCIHSRLLLVISCLRYSKVLNRLQHTLRHCERSAASDSR